MISSISSSEVRLARTSDVRRVITRLTAFMLPFALFPGIPLALAFEAGELTPLAVVAERQLHEPLLYGRAYRDNFFAFKLISAEIRRPRVLVLGSSRVMQFRASMFESPVHEFYNAGGAARSFVDAAEFIRRLPVDGRPRVIVLGVDQPWLLQAAAFDEADARAMDPDTYDVRRLVRLSQSVVQDLYLGKISIPRTLGRRAPSDGAPALGMKAIMTGDGFRSDGSYQYGAYMTGMPPIADRLKEGFERLADNIVPMVRASALDAAALQQLRDMLALSRQYGLRIVGFSPPFAPSTIVEMRRTRGFGYLETIEPTLSVVFAEFGFRYFDWSDPTALGATDADMIDYFHPSETVVQRIARRLADAEPSLRPGTGR